MGGFRVRFYGAGDLLGAKCRPGVARCRGVRTSRGWRWSGRAPLSHPGPRFLLFARVSRAGPRRAARTRRLLCAARRGHLLGWRSARMLAVLVRLRSPGFNFIRVSDTLHAVDAARAGRSCRAPASTTSPRGFGRRRSGGWPPSARRSSSPSKCPSRSSASVPARSAADRSLARYPAEALRRGGAAAGRRA